METFSTWVISNDIPCHRYVVGRFEKMNSNILQYTILHYNTMECYLIQVERGTLKVLGLYAPPLLVSSVPRLIPLRGMGRA